MKSKALILVLAFCTAAGPLTACSKSVNSQNQADIIGGWACIGNINSSSAKATEYNAKFDYLKFEKNGIVLETTADLPETKNGQSVYNVSSKTYTKGSYELSGNKLTCSINGKTTNYTYAPSNDSLKPDDKNNKEYVRDWSSVDMKTASKSKNAYTNTLTGTWTDTIDISPSDTTKIKTSKGNGSTMTFRSDGTVTVSGSKESGYYAVRGNIIYAEFAKKTIHAYLTDSSDKSVKELNLSKNITSSQKLLLTDEEKENSTFALWTKK